MKIITISREFGSGGRELAKRLADELGFDYYDREIIETIAKEQGLNKEYVSNILDNHQWNTVPITFRNSFSISYYSSPAVSLLAQEKKTIEDIAKAGHNFIIVGRNADIFLKDFNPLNIFVCADMEFKIKRCREKKNAGDNMSDREIEKNIKRINKNRFQAREMLGESEWGKNTSYDLTVNTSKIEIKKLATMLADFARAWFAE